MTSYGITREAKIGNSSIHRVRKHREKNFEFIGVDGEGAGYGENHRYVLLGCGDRYVENIEGLSWKQCFEFLYSQFKERPQAAFVGFFLGYDFTEILASLPEERARMLLTERGINARKRSRSGGNNKPFPVRYDGWEFDMLPGRRLQIRPQACDCLQRGQRECSHRQYEWMYICDSGPFWQTSLLNAINPRDWKFPVVTQEEYSKLEIGKANRSMSVEEYIAQRKRVIEYNQIENAAFCRAMDQLRDGFSAIGVHLSKDKWFGPGQAAAAWFQKNGVPKRNVIEAIIPDWFLESARKSYFGGWFEIFSHGIIPGSSYEYDINSAYPYVMSKLPCLLHGRYSNGDGAPPNASSGRTIALVRARCSGNDPYIGALLNRDSTGRIRRPSVTEGWYWLHEIEAAQRAGIVETVEFREWVSYNPCDCPPPIRGYKDLYNHRLRVGKDSILGKSSKLVYNSGYGKCAQSTGSSPYGNWVYASLITAGCREMILDAISSHPNGTKSVLMVATDGIFFDSPHDGIQISKVLGEWDYRERKNLTLFKPGVYWDDEARYAISTGSVTKFKARGVNSRDFSKHLGAIDWKFLCALDPIPEFRIKLFEGGGYTAYTEEPWPSIEFPVEFSLVSAKTALNRGNWSEAGETRVNLIVKQDSDPIDKRREPYFDPEMNRIRTHPPKLSEDEIVTEPYQKKYGLEDPFGMDTQEWMGISWDGTVAMQMQALARILTGRE